MLMKEARGGLIAYGKKLVDAGLTKGTGGNLSVYDPQTGLMAITPSGIDFYQIQPEDMVIMNLEGEVVQGHRRPSSEWQMHALLYKRRKDMTAVIHAHTTYATVFAVLREAIPPSHYMIAVAGKEVPCADYATYGTMDLAENACKAMGDRYAVLLANHGIIAGKDSLAEAFNIIEEVEFVAKIHLMARAIGNPVILDDTEMTKMLDKFQDYK